MIIATRIRSLTDRMRRDTLQAAEQRPRPQPHQQLIDYLERRGYRVVRPLKAA